MKKREIVEKVMAIYIADPSKRSKSANDICLYNGPNNKHCAVGQCLKDEFKVGTELDDFNSNIRGVTNLKEYSLNILLKKEYQGHSIDFWEDVQRMHDDNTNWDLKGLTTRGEIKYNKLIEKYSV